jgi:hypothetical protein
VEYVANDQHLSYDFALFLTLNSLKINHIISVNKVLRLQMILCYKININKKMHATNGNIEVFISNQKYNFENREHFYKFITSIIRNFNFFDCKNKSAFQEILKQNIKSLISSGLIKVTKSSINKNGPKNFGYRKFIINNFDLLDSYYRDCSRWSICVGIEKDIFVRNKIKKLVGDDLKISFDLECDKIKIYNGTINSKKYDDNNLILNSSNKISEVTLVKNIVEFGTPSSREENIDINKVKIISNSDLVIYERDIVSTSIINNNINIITIIDSFIKPKNIDLSRYFNMILTKTENKIFQLKSIKNNSIGVLDYIDDKIANINLINPLSIGVFIPSAVKEEDKNLYAELQLSLEKVINLFEVLSINYRDNLKVTKIKMEINEIKNLSKKHYVENKDDVVSGLKKCLKEMISLRDIFDKNSIEFVFCRGVDIFASRIDAIILLIEKWVVIFC